MTLDAFRAVAIHCNILGVTQHQNDEYYTHTYTEELVATFFKRDHEEFAVSLFRKAVGYSKMLFPFRNDQNTLQ
jgi:hypothetical protein